MDAGELRGPFSGRVVDAATGDPVEDAVVYASWSFTRGYGEQVPAGVREHASSTDDQGRYRVPAVKGAPGDARLSGAYLVIYKPGYVAYRSDRRFSDLGLRRDFAQKHNDVALARWQQEYSHVRHLRFLGSGEALAEVTADERARAAAELAGEPERAPPVPSISEPPSEGLIEEPVQDPEDEVVAPLDVPRAPELLTKELVTEVTGDEGPFESGPLADQPDTDTYSSQHIRAVDRPEAYDVALRLWVEGAEDARERYEEFETSLPEAETRDELADRSLRTSEPGIRGIAFFDEEVGAVALLVCGDELCSSEDVAAELAQKVHAELEAASAGDEVEEGEGEPEGEGGAEAETESDRESEADTEPEGESESESADEDEGESESEPESEGESESEPETETGADGGVGTEGAEP